MPKPKISDIKKKIKKLETTAKSKKTKDDLIAKPKKVVGGTVAYKIRQEREVKKIFEEIRNIINSDLEKADKKDKVLEKISNLEQIPPISTHQFLGNLRYLKLSQIKRYIKEYLKGSNDSVTQLQYFIDTNQEVRVRIEKKMQKEMEGEEDEFREEKQQTKKRTRMERDVVLVERDNNIVYIYSDKIDDILREMYTTIENDDLTKDEKKEKVEEYIDKLSNVPPKDENKYFRLLLELSICNIRDYLEYNQFADIRPIKSLELFINENSKIKSRIIEKLSEMQRRKFIRVKVDKKKVVEPEFTKRVEIDIEKGEEPQKIFVKELNFPTAESCIKNENNKPWIPNYSYTIIKSFDDTDLSNKIFVGGPSKVYSPYSGDEGWYLANRNFSKFLCRTDRPSIQQESTLIIFENSAPIRLIVGYVLNDGSVILQNEELVETRQEWLRMFRMSIREVIDEIMDQRIGSSKYNDKIRETIKIQLTLIIQKNPDFIEHLENEIYRPNDKVKEYIEKIAKIIVLFRDSKIKRISHNIQHRIREDSITPSDLINMNVNELIPEIYKNEDVSVLQQSQFEEHYNLAVSQTVKTLGYLIYGIINPTAKRIFLKDNALFTQFDETKIPQYADVIEEEEKEEEEKEEEEKEEIKTERMLAPGFGRILEESIRNLENRLRHKNRPDLEEDITSERSYVSESKNMSSEDKSGYSFMSEKDNEKMSDIGSDEKMSDIGSDIGSSEKMSDIGSDIGSSEKMSDIGSDIGSDEGSSEKMSDIGSDIGSDEGSSEKMSDIGSDIGSDEGSSEKMSDIGSDIGSSEKMSDIGSSEKSSENMSEKSSRFSYRGGDIKTIKIENSRPTERVYNSINDLINDNNWNKNEFKGLIQN